MFKEHDFYKMCILFYINIINQIYTKYSLHSDKENLIKL